MTTRHQIVQDIILHEVVLKVKPLLDQLTEGMGTLTTLIRTFPDTFKSLFLATATTQEEVVKILMKEEEMTEEKKVVWRCWFVLSVNVR